MDRHAAPSPAQDQIHILQGPTPPDEQSTRPTTPSSTPHAAAAPSRPVERFASPPITLRRPRQRATPSGPWTLGDFLTAATKGLSSTLPTPGRKLRRPPLNFSPRRGRSATTAKAKPAAPPTAERRAHVQVLCTLGIIGVNQPITAEAMKAYDRVFAAPIPNSVLAAIAALVGRELPDDPTTAPITTVIAGSPIEA